MVAGVGEMGALVNRSLGRLKTSFEVGETVRGTVVSVAQNSIFVDIGAKSEGILDANEFRKQRMAVPGPGSAIEAYVVGTGSADEILLSVSMHATEQTDDAMNEAYTAGVAVDGRVQSERKGGFEVVIGSHRGFCPYSQIDLYPATDRTAYIGQRLSFLIMEYSGSNLVVSRRKFLERERERQRQHLKDILKINDVVTGTVRRIMDFGAFVDIGGFDGLIPMGELSWTRAKTADEVLAVGETVSVRIIDIQWDKDRVTLSLRKAGDDPWGTVRDQYHETKQYAGIVTSLHEFGAFVTLGPGIEGLLPISKLGAGKRLRHSSEVLKEKDSILVYIEKIDPERRRISLSLSNPQQGRAVAGDGPTVKVGETVMGEVEGVKPFGVFVRLPGGRTGLLHVSELGEVGRGHKGQDLAHRFPLESAVEVIVKNVHGERISLALPSVASEETNEFRAFVAAKQEKDGFGSLGSLFETIAL